MESQLPECGVRANAGINDGDIFTATGWRLGPDGRMHQCEIGQETKFVAVVTEDNRLKVQCDLVAKQLKTNAIYTEEWLMRGKALLYLKGCGLSSEDAERKLFQIEAGGKL